MGTDDSRQPTRILFLCTGNTCRSPMAEALFRGAVAERLVIAEDSVREHGYDVFSAGIAAEPHAPASVNSVLAMQERGSDLTQHLSRPVTHEMLDAADWVFGMTTGHLDAVRSARPDLESKLHLLDPAGQSISDPYGGVLDEYRRCADQIASAVSLRADEILSDRADKS